MPSTNDLPNAKRWKKAQKFRNQKRRARLPESELFEERGFEEEPNEQVTTVKVRRTGNDANA